MTNQTPDHIPPVPEGYVYGGQLCDYPTGQYIPGRICQTGAMGWSSFEPDWMAVDENYASGHWHIAVPATSDLGRRILAERGKPDWKDAPDWAEWLAQDWDGGWYWYKNQPEARGGEWDEADPDGGASCLAEASKGNPNWRETLERRARREMHVTEDPPVQADPENAPRAIIPPDLVEAGTAAWMRAKGYRVEWDDDGIRGWKE